MNYCRHEFFPPKHGRPTSRNTFDTGPIHASFLVELFKTRHTAQRKETDAVARHPDQVFLFVFLKPIGMKGLLELLTSGCCMLGFKFAATFVYFFFFNKKFQIFLGSPFNQTMRLEPTIRYVGTALRGRRPSVRKERLEIVIYFSSIIFFL